MESLNAAQGTSKRLSPAARGRIQAYPWHGNVRELKNQLQRAFFLYDGVIELSDLTAERAPSPPGPEVGGSLEESERKLILATLQQCNGDKKEAAQILGISPRRCTTDSPLTKPGNRGSQHCKPRVYRDRMKGRALARTLP